MPNPQDPWSAAWAEAAASNPKDVVQLETLEVWHASFGLEVVRCVNDVRELDARIDNRSPRNAGDMVTFKAIPFRFGSPSSEEGRAPEASVVIDNIGREVGRYLFNSELMNAPLEAIFRVYLSNDLSEVALGPFRFFVRRVRQVGADVRGQAVVANPQLLRFLRQTYDAKTFPALLKGS